MGEHARDLEHEVLSLKIADGEVSSHYKMLSGPTQFLMLISPT